MLSILSLHNNLNIPYIDNLKYDFKIVNPEVSPLLTGSVARVQNIAATNMAATGGPRNAEVF